MQKLMIAFAALSLALATVSFSHADDFSADSRNWIPGQPTSPPWDHCPSNGWWNFSNPVFAMPIQLWVQPYRITANLYNGTGYRLGCQVVLEGWTAWGRFQRAPITMPPLWPGQTGNVFMTPLTYGDYFTNGRGWAWCQYI